MLEDTISVTMFQTVNCLHASFCCANLPDKVHDELLKHVLDPELLTEAAGTPGIQFEASLLLSLNFFSKVIREQLFERFYLMLLGQVQHAAACLLAELEAVLRLWQAASMQVKNAHMACGHWGSLQKPLPAPTLGLPPLPHASGHMHLGPQALLHSSGGDCPSRLGVSHSTWAEGGGACTHRGLILMHGVRVPNQSAHDQIKDPGECTGTSTVKSQLLLPARVCRAPLVGQPLQFRFSPMIVLYLDNIEEVCKRMAPARPAWYHTELSALQQSPSYTLEQKLSLGNTLGNVT